MYSIRSSTNLFSSPFSNFPNISTKITIFLFRESTHFHSKVKVICLHCIALLFELIFHFPLHYTFHFHQLLLSAHLPKRPVNLLFNDLPKELIIQVQGLPGWHFREKARRSPFILYFHQVYHRLAWLNTNNYVLHK